MGRLALRLRTLSTTPHHPIRYLVLPKVIHIVQDPILVGGDVLDDVTD